MHEEQIVFARWSRRDERDCAIALELADRLHDRLEPLSAVIRNIAWKAQVRLCARYRRLAAAGKPKVVVTTAIAREMVTQIRPVVLDRLKLRRRRPKPGYVGQNVINGIYSAIGR